jgi:rod shape-determining protein MreD
LTHFLAATGLLVVAALVQSTLGEQLPFLAGRPDLPLLVVLAWGMLRGHSEGAAAGFLGGLILDSVSYTPFGLHAALHGLVGYGVGLAKTNLYRGNLPFFVAAALSATLFLHVCSYLFLQAAGSRMPPLGYSMQLALASAALNAMLIGPAFLMSRSVLRLLDGWRELRL